MAGEISQTGPHQPKEYSFPLRDFGRKGEKRSFKSAWFNEWPWLDYNEKNDSVICFYCSCANKKKLLPKGLFSKREETYISKGFTNWKDACSSFR